MATPAKKTATTTALTPDQINRLKGLGINVKTEPEARKALVEIMKKNEVEGVDDDPINDLLEMVSVFNNGSDEEAGEDAEVDGEDEDTDTEEDTDTDEEEEEEVVTKTTKKTATKPATKAATKTAKAKPSAAKEEEEVEELIDEVASKSLKPAPKVKATPKEKSAASTRARKLEGKRWEDMTDVEKQTALKPFKALLPEKLFRFEMLQKSFTVKYLGKSSEQNIFKYHLLRQLTNGELEGCFISHRYKTPDEFAEVLPDLDGRKLLQGDSCAYVHPFKQSEIFEVIKTTDFLKESIVRAEKQDTKMRNGRESLERQLTEGKTTTPAVKEDVKATKSVKVAPKASAEEAEEEEEAVVTAPAKTTTKAVPSSKVDNKKVTAPVKTASKKK